MTLRELITGSLRLLNATQAGQAPSADDMAVGVEALNALIDSWSSERLLIYTISPHYFQLQAGKKDYTLGPDGDFNITRPLEIESAYVTLSGAVESAPVPGDDDEFDLLAEDNVPIQSETGTDLQVEHV
jgi:hypothetical protein